MLAIVNTVRERLLVNFVLSTAKGDQQPIDVPTLNRLDGVFMNALQAGANITPQAAQAIYEDYFTHRTVADETHRRRLPATADEFKEALTHASTVIKRRLREGHYPPPKHESSPLLDPKTLRDEQVSAAFATAREEAEKSTARIVIAR